MRRQFVASVILMLAGLAPTAFAADHYLYGNIVNVTTHADGLLVMLDTGVPINCTGVAYGCMTIPEANKAMIAVALIAWQMGRGATVFTNPLSVGVCTINQFDPAES